jgi:DNA-binding GntR family transcriptional regulator
MTVTERGESRTFETHQRLRSDIIQGVIRPNERLIASDLAERLKISRTPVREALQLLEAEGLVVLAKRGYMVREHTVDEVREIYEVRGALEGMAARLAASRAGDETLNAIEAMGAHEEGVARSGRSALVDLNEQFHAAIIAASGNQRLGEINRRNSQQFFNYKIAELYTDEEAVSSVRGHAAIVNALRARDADAAERAARAHCEEALQVTLRKTQFRRIG